jgi:membrane peptidoglycan carboxypeptidase
MACCASQQTVHKREHPITYLEIAYFGSGLRGADAAASVIWGVASYDDLPLTEAAQLAAMLVYPRPLEPTERWLGKVNRRAHYALRIFPQLEKRIEKIPS